MRRVEKSWIKLIILCGALLFAQSEETSDFQRVFGQPPSPHMNSRLAKSPNRNHPLRPKVSSVASRSTRMQQTNYEYSTEAVSEPPLPEYHLDDRDTRGFETHPSASRYDKRQTRRPQHSSNIQDSWGGLYDSEEEQVQIRIQKGSEQETSLSHSPVVYRYFGRSRARLHTADSIPFILLGPCVDHWKTTGETLASRGFSVMACELVDEQEADRRRSSGPQGQPDEGKNLILAVLDALRWNRAILVGCDEEAVKAIEAAMRLAPRRVAGLVLCGNLKSVEKMVQSRQMGASADSKGYDVVDSFLRGHLDCPYTIIWDGNEHQKPRPSAEPVGSGDMFALNRCLILGGGMSPHRRLPEQFAWALTRFVEEKIAPLKTPLAIQASQESAPSGSEKRSRWRKRNFLPYGLDDMFTPGGLLVAGRIVASVIMYASAMKVAVYQYENLNVGIQWISESRRRLFRTGIGLCRNVGCIFRVLHQIRIPRFGSKIQTLPGQDDASGGDPIEPTTPAEEEPPEEPDEDPMEEEEDKGYRRLFLLDTVVV